MNHPNIETSLIGPGSFDFWRRKLYELREVLYRKMDDTGICPICGQSKEPHLDDCGFAKIEKEIMVEHWNKASGGAP